jgi:hypothetical protein
VERCGQVKRPAFQFYPSDWRKDEPLQDCSIAARGLWHELLCIMHECQPYGHLALNGAALPEEKAAKRCGITVQEFRRLLAELEAARVFSRTANGTIYSRRMVKDEHIRTTRAAGGARGGSFGERGKDFGTQGGRPVTRGDMEPPLEPPIKPPLHPPLHPPLEPPIKPPPSSSASSSSEKQASTPTDTPSVDKSKSRGDKSPNGEQQTFASSREVWQSKIERKASTVGLTARPGEEWDDFSARVDAEIARRSENRGTQ